MGRCVQPIAGSGKEQSLRKGDADELKFGEERGGIGSASAAYAVTRLVIFARLVLEVPIPLAWACRGGAERGPKMFHFGESPRSSPTVYYHFLFYVCSVLTSAKQA